VIPLRKERGIYAASMSDGRETLENFERSVLRTLKRRERRAPSATGNRLCFKHGSADKITRLAISCATLRLEIKKASIPGRL
jgi:hypothetical protein